MPTLVYSAPVRAGADRVYARIETETDSDGGTLTDTRLGTVASDHLELDPVREAERDDGSVELDAMDGYYTEQILEDFTERPLVAFVDELVERTPYPRPQAEVVVTCGWFRMDRRQATRMINQHLRDTYDHVSPSALQERIEAARETHAQIRNAQAYPFDL